MKVQLKDFFLKSEKLLNCLKTTKNVLINYILVKNDIIFIYLFI